MLGEQRLVRLLRPRGCCCLSGARRELLESSPDLRMHNLYPTWEEGKRDLVESNFRSASGFAPVTMSHIRKMGSGSAPWCPTPAGLAGAGWHSLPGPWVLPEGDLAARQRGATSAP